MPEQTSPKSWLAALGEAATAQGIPWPGFDVFAMGTARSDKTQNGRYVTLKERYSPDPERRDVLWSLWQANRDAPVLVATFVTPADPTPERVATSLPLFRGWLVEGWPPEQTQANVGKHPGALSVPTRPTPDRKEYWLSEEGDFGFIVFRDKWQLIAGHRSLSRWQHKEDGENGNAFGLDSLGRLCSWLAEHWQAIAFGNDSRPPVMMEYNVSASRAYARAVRALGEAHSSDLQQWEKRHAIRQADCELPNVFFERQADDVVVSWDARPSQSRSFEIGSGVAVMSAVVAVPRLRNLVEDHINLSIRDLLREDSAGYQAARRYREFATKEWLERHAFFEEDARELAHSGTSRHPVIGLLRSGQGSALTAEDYEAVFALLKESKQGSYEQLRNLARGMSVSIDPREPWESGYWLATNVRERLGMDPETKPDIDNLLRDLGVDVQHLTLSDPHILGVCVGTPRFAPLVVVNLACEKSTGTSGRRLTLAHELCHLLFDRTGFRNLARFEGGTADGDRLIEMRANAFAVYFLVPMSNLLEAGEWVPNERLGEIAKQWEVSKAALEKHLKNARNQ